MELLNDYLKRPIHGNAWLKLRILRQLIDHPGWHSIAELVDACYCDLDGGCLTADRNTWDACRELQGYTDDFVFIEVTGSNRKPGKVRLYDWRLPHMKKRCEATFHHVFDAEIRKGVGSTASPHSKDWRRTAEQE